MRAEVRWWAHRGGRAGIAAAPRENLGGLNVPPRAHTDVRELPHAYPFLFVDRVLMVEPNAWAAVRKTVSRNEAFVGTDGLLPPILLCEMMAQAAGLAVAVQQGDAAVLAAVDRFRCRPPIVAGDELLVIVRVVRRFGANVKARAVIRSNDRVRAAGDLMLHFVMRPPPPLPIPATGEGREGG